MAGVTVPPPTRSRLVAVLLAVSCLLVAGTGWVGGQAWQARTHLQAAGELARQLQREVEAGEIQRARQTLAALQQETGAARASTSGPGWRVGRRAGAAGQNLAALTTVAAALDELAHEGMPPLIEAAAVLRPRALAPTGGRIELAPLVRANPAVAAAAQATDRARARVAAIDRRWLVPQLRSALDELDRMLAQGARDLATVARAAALLPSMLGADGPRTYLLLFQNPAEVRATGGMPGAFAVVRADRGALRLVRQGSAAADLGAFEEPVLPLDPAVRALYTDRPGRYPANVNLTPHFPTAAKLAREMYRVRFGEKVDGVLATDPVALSYLLRATGPVAMPSGPPLTAGNAVRMLLSEAYARFPDKAEQHRYLAAAAAASFETMITAWGDPRAAVAGLARAAGERRILVWSAHPREQRLIEETVLAGALPAEDGLRPTVGVFLNDAGGAKLSYYLTQQAELRAGDCRSDGRRELLLRVRLGSTAPASGLPPSVLGLARAGDPYTVRTNVSIFSPAGGALVDVRTDGAAAPVGSGMERGRAVGIVPIEIPPGGHRTIEAVLLTADLPRQEPVHTDLWVTPTATDWTTTAETGITCADRS